MPLGGSGFWERLIGTFIPTGGPLLSDQINQETTNLLNGVNDKLPRDGRLPMTGPLNMDGNRIFNTIGDGLSFATRAGLSAANLLHLPNGSTVEVRGRSAAGEVLERFRKFETAPTTPTANEIQSADGGWWGLVDAQINEFDTLDNYKASRVTGLARVVLPNGQTLRLNPIAGAPAPVKPWHWKSTNDIYRVPDHRDEITPMMFGALGGNNDDTAAIQAAIDFAHTFVPALDVRLTTMHKITASLVINRPIDSLDHAGWFTIAGGGIRVESAIDVFTSTLPPLAQTPVPPVSQNLRLMGVNFVSLNADPPGRLLDKNKIMRVLVMDCSFDKMRIINSDVSYLQSMYFIGNNARNWQGTWFYASKGNYDLKIEQNLIEHGEDFIILGDNSGQQSLSGCTVKSNCIEGLSGTGIRYGGARGLTISDNYFEGNAGYDIDGNYAPLASGQSLMVTITGNMHSQTAANKLIPAYRSVNWGNIANGVAFGNYCDGVLHGGSTANVALFDKLKGPVSGWTPMTGPTDKATAFASNTVALPQLASRVKALQDDFTTVIGLLKP